MRRCKLPRFILATFVAMGLMISAAGARAQGGDTQDLAKDSQNPVSDLISVPLENNFTFNNGPEDAFAYILNIKPVIPMGISKNWNLINRIILPVIYQEDFVSGEGSTFGGTFVSPGVSREDSGAGEGSIFGLGDITYQGFLSPKKPGKFIWGVGPIAVVPTGMDRLSSDQWSLGANAVGLTMPGPWVLGAIVSNIWSVAGYGDAPDVNLFTLQPFVNYNLNHGWYLTTAPIITANWEADDDNTWTVPVGGGAGRVFKMGNMPVNAKLSLYNSVVRPENASDWTIEAQINLLFPK